MKKLPLLKAVYTCPNITKTLLQCYKEGHSYWFVISRANCDGVPPA